MLAHIFLGVAGEAVFQAVASETRRKLLDALLSGEHTVTELVDQVDVTQGAVSQQLAVLEGAGLVAQRAQGRFRFYSLRPEPLALVDQWLAGYRNFVAERLDVLGRVLDAMPNQRKR